MYLVDCIDRETDRQGRDLNADERFAVLDENIRGMAKGNKLNLLIDDGEQIYVHTNYEDSLYYCRMDKMLLFATVPLERGCWKPVPFMQMLGAADGEIIRRGQKHGNAYIESEENIRFLYQAFSNL